MDFSKVLGYLISDFEREKISYALIGGFALIHETEEVSQYVSDLKRRYGKK